MKRNKLIWLGLFVLSLVGISFYGGPVTYGFCGMMLFLPVIALIYLGIVYYRFKVFQRIEGKGVVSGQNVNFYFTLQNEDILTYAGISVVFYSTLSTINGIETDTEYELAPFMGIQKQTVLVCKYRGNYEVGIEKIVVRDFLRLFTITFKNKSPFTVNVSPKIVYLNEMSELEATLSFVHENSFRSNEPDIPVRDYFQGDDIRFINWKTTAKTGKLKVRKRIGEDEPGVSIIMDSTRYGQEPVEFLPIENKLLELNLALTYYVLQKKIKVNEFYLNTGKMVCRELRAVENFEEYYSEMSAFSFKSTQGTDQLFEQTLQMPEVMDSHTVIFLVHEWTPVMAEAALILSNNNIPVMVYLVTDSLNEPDGIDASKYRISFRQVGLDMDLMELCG